MTRGKSVRTLASLAFLVVFSVFLSACKKDSTSPGGPGSVITVSGKVIGQNLQPVAGVPVYIAGLTSVNTDGTGSFTIANVTIPYTITVVDGTNKRAIVYRGLSRPDPTLVWLGVSPGATKSANLSGTIFPWTATGATTRTTVAFVSPEAGASSSANAATGAYSLTGVQWYGASTTVGTVHALQWDYDASTLLPTTFRKYGIRSGVTLLDAASNPNGNDTVAAVTNGSITGSVTAPTGYTISTKAVLAAFGANSGINIATEGGNTTSFSYVTPNITGTTMTLEAIATKSGSGSSTMFKSGIAPTTSGLALSIPVAPELSLPVNSATGVKTSTPFSWNPVPNGVYVLEILGSGSNPTYYVLTTATSDSIPNLSTVGLGLPVATGYSWNVVALAPFGSIDAAASAGGFTGGLTSISTDHSFSLGATRSFTTAP